MYCLDGYNLLFTSTQSDGSFPRQRQKMISFLQERFALLKMSGLLVFDGRVRPGEESGRSWRSPLEIIYTSKGQSADDFIEEKIAISKNPGLITVVTNDRMLSASVRHLGAKTMKNADFLKKILKRKKEQGPKTTYSDTKKNIERLLKLFEKKLLDEDY